MRTKTLLLLPFLLVWWLIELVALPVALIAVAWWVLPDSWARLVTLFLVGYLLVVLWLFRAVLRGKVRSLTRGTVVVRRDGRAGRRRVRR